MNINLPGGASFIDGGPDRSEVLALPLAGSASVVVIVGVGWGWVWGCDGVCVCAYILVDGSA